MTIGITLQLFIDATPRSNMSGITACWWDSTDPSQIASPAGKTVGASTDATGTLNLDLSSVSALSVGAPGFLLLYLPDAQSPQEALVFAGVVDTSEVVSGIPLGYIAESDASASAAIAVHQAAIAQDCAEQTAQDKAQTALDRIATAENRIATAADREQTGIDAAAASSAKTAAELAASSASTQAEDASGSATAAAVSAATASAKAEEASGSATAAAVSAATASAKAALLGSVATTSATGTIALTAESAVYQLINPNGAARDVTLPTLTAGDAGRAFVVKNTESTGNFLTIKTSSGTQVGPALGNGYTLFVVWSGSVWEAL